VNTHSLHPYPPNLTRLPSLRPSLAKAEAHRDAHLGGIVWGAPAHFVRSAAVGGALAFLVAFAYSRSGTAAATLVPCGTFIAADGAPPQHARSIARQDVSCDVVRCYIRAPAIVPRPGATGVAVGRIRARRPSTPALTARGPAPRPSGTRRLPADATGAARSCRSTSGAKTASTRVRTVTEFAPTASKRDESQRGERHDGAELSLSSSKQSHVDSGAHEVPRVDPLSDGRRLRSRRGALKARVAWRRRIARVRKQLRRIDGRTALDR